MNFPYYKDGKVHFSQGAISLGKCTLAELQEFFGQTCELSQENGQKIILLPNEFGQLRLGFDPGEEILGNVLIESFSILLDEELALEQLKEFYQVEPLEYFASFHEPEQTDCFAFFVPNFGVRFNLQTKVATTLMFYTRKNLISCKCPICIFILENFSFEGAC